MTRNPIYQETDRCVKCGLCLPHCPTYLQLADEADSPRGRIALIQAIFTHQLPLNGKLQAHLDRCLGCRACERVCPSGVRYGRLIDAARNRIQLQRNPAASGLELWLFNNLISRNRLHRYSRLLSWLNRTRLLELGRKLTTGRLEQLMKIAQLLPDRAQGPGLYPAGFPPRGKSVQLFIGCVSSQADISAIEAAIKVLTRFGYAVDIPVQQACCGALHRHNGFPETARHLCETNRQQTGNSRSIALLTLASACELELLEQDASRLPVFNVVDFLSDILESEQWILTALPARVAVHTPCSARGDQTLRLLDRIPELEVFSLPANDQCCGAAGSYILTQPKLSLQLGRDKLEHLKRTAPDILVTGNTGCAIQFKLLLKEQNPGIEVLHPIELIERQLQIVGIEA